MVDPNRQASMEVILESQSQLVSRIGLAIKNNSKLSFLHGNVGVGKSHVAHLLQQNLDKVNVVKLQLKAVMEPEQLKEQIVCELATGELSDLNQPISTAVNDGILRNNLSTLLIIDNAELMPQQTLSALWQSLHEVTRINQTNYTFNVLLIGDSRWALPMHHGLNNTPDSLAAEFLLSALTSQEANDFMMRVHVDWSEQKIQEFIKKVPPEYLIPKQLIYAQIPLSARYKRKVVLSISALIVILAIVTVFANYSMQEQNSELIATRSNVPDVAILSPAVTKEPQKEDSIIDVISVAQPKKKVDSIIADEVSIELPEPSTELPESPTEVIENNLEKEIVPDNTDNVKVIKKEIVKAPPQIINAKESLIKSFNFDEQYLLDLPTKGYALMIGGYSSHQTLLVVEKRFKSINNLKQYETIRYDQPWFVLLYGTFDNLKQANEFVKDNAAIFKGFSPWAKPYKSIKKEIHIGYPTIHNKKEDNG